MQNSSNSSAVPPVRRSIEQVFSALREKRGLAMMPFIPAGYPDLETTAALLPALESAGASLFEIGFPFSDPIADGPTVQEAFTAALAKKIKVADVFRTIAGVRAKVSIPMVGMLSYSIVFRYGLERFIAEAKAAGLDGLILPDLPPPEAQGICDAVRAGGLETILLIAPTTTPERRKQIADLSSGFIYYLSVSGITGERDQLPADLAEGVRGLKRLTERPVCVGFGISKPHHLQQLKGLADGAIIGSAVVKQIKGHEREGPAKIAEAVANFVKEMLSGVRQT